MKSNLPFTISASARERLRRASILSEPIDAAFHIGKSEIDGQQAEESIHLCGYPKGVLDERTFFDVAGLRISIPDNVLKVLAGHELIVEERTMEGGRKYDFLWIT